MNPEFSLLPQYGSVALPYSGLPVVLVGEKNSQPVSTVLESSPFDSVLGTSPQEVARSAVLIGARTSFEVLDSYNQAVLSATQRPARRLSNFKLLSPIRFRNTGILEPQKDKSVQVRTPGDYAACTVVDFLREHRVVDVDLNRRTSRVRLRVRQNHLEMTLAIAPGRISTQEYVLRTDDAEVRNFLMTSLKYYANLPGPLLGQSADDLVAANLVLAADLIFHQQFALTGEAPFPYSARAAVVTRPLEKTLQDGLLTIVAVNTEHRRKPVVEIRQLGDNSLEIFIRKPRHHAPTMPLKYNVLMLGARLMNPALAAAPFFDFMPGAVLI